MNRETSRKVKALMSVRDKETSQAESPHPRQASRIPGKPNNRQPTETHLPTSSQDNQPEIGKNQISPRILPTPGTRLPNRWARKIILASNPQVVPPQGEVENQVPTRISSRKLAQVSLAVTKPISIMPAAKPS